MKDKHFNNKILRSTRKPRELLRTSKNISMYINQTHLSNSLETKWNQILFSEQSSHPKLEIKQFTLTDETILQEFLISFLPISIKPLTSQSIAIHRVFLEIVQEGKKSSFLQQLEWMPVYFILKKWKKIGRILEYLKICNKEQDFQCWTIWFNLFHQKQPKLHCDDFSLYSKLANFFSISTSNSWGSFSKASFILKSEQLGDLSKILLEFLNLSTKDYSETKENLSTLTSLIQEPYSKLVICIIISHYLNYNQINSAQMCCMYFFHKFSGELKDLSAGYLMKLSGIQRNLLKISDENNLFEVYHFVRASVKFNLQVPLNKLKIFFDILDSGLAEMRFFSCMFDVKVRNMQFWQFIMFRNIFMQKKAADSAKEALSFKKTSEFKFKVMTEYLQEYREQEDIIRNQMNQGKVKDEYLKDVFFMVSWLKGDKNDSDLPFFRSLSCPFRFEAVLLNWVRAYRVNKSRESLFKINENSQDDKLDPLHPLFYYKIFKNYLNGILRAENFYLGMKLNQIFEEIGKDYYGLKVFDCFCIVQAKSYARTNIRKSVVKLMKNCEKFSVHPLVKYFLIKFEVEYRKIIGRNKNKKMLKLSVIFEDIVSVGLSQKYVEKCKISMEKLMKIKNM